MEKVRKIAKQEVQKHVNAMHMAKGGRVSAPDAGYPQTGVKTSGTKMRGAGAATKGTMARGPMA